MELKKRRCKTCGCSFVPREKGERFCSSVCKTAGLFLGGGGDTSKPGSTSFAEKSARPSPTLKRVKSDDDRYAMVRKMFTLPFGERYEISKNFTKDEAEYARRIARRMMAEDDRINRETSWNSDFEDGENSDEVERVVWEISTTESDDGSI